MWREYAVLLMVLSASYAEEGSTCDVVKDPVVRYFDIRIPETEVPGDLTTYVCQHFLIPVSMDVTYHAVAFEPIIMNENVMHHMILFGCPDEIHNELHQCGGNDNLCRTFLVQWSMGIKSQICSFPDTGVRFGFGSLKSMALQIHWNNAKRVKGLLDSSGIRIYYTTHLRKYDVGNVQIGQNDLEIPPGISHTTISGSCSSDCTYQWLKTPIYLTRAHLHLHYVGDGGIMELYRSGEKIRTITKDLTYDYNSPPVHCFDKPVEVLPGDAVKLTCYYNTKDGGKARNRTLFWGEGSNGEMCYAFVTYYPKVNHFDQCIQFDHYDVCNADGVAALGECVFGGFLRVFMFDLSEKVLTHCTALTVDGAVNSSNNGVTGADSIKIDPRVICSDDCEKAVKEVTEHPCMQGRLGQETRRVYLPKADSWAQIKVILNAVALYCVD